MALLNKDGLISSAEIAGQLGDVSARTVANPINALIERGIINFRSIINSEVLGNGMLADVFIQGEKNANRPATENR